MTPDQLSQAACKGRNRNLWFPVPSSGDRRNITAWRTQGAQAIAICGTCPIRVPCGDEAIIQGDYESIRGGLTPPERRRIALGNVSRVKHRESAGQRHRDYSTTVAWLDEALGTPQAQSMRITT